MTERRTWHPGGFPWVFHEWDKGEVLLEEDIPAQWARMPIKCRHCGDERLVWWALDLDLQIYDECPIAPPKMSIRKRLFGCGRDD